MIKSMNQFVSIARSNTDESGSESTVCIYTQIELEFFE